MAYEPPEVRLSGRVVKLVIIWLCIMLVPAITMMFAFKLTSKGWF